MTNSNKVHPLSRAAGLTVALLGPFMAGDVTAQATATKLLCSSLGGASGEPIGDRPGHTIQASRTSCRIEGGPMDGGLAAINAILEFDGATGTLLSGDGVMRKPGALVAFRTTAGTVTLTMKDGAVTGWTASGKGTITMATGGAAMLAGKPYTWAGRPVGPGQNMQEWTMD